MLIKETKCSLDDVEKVGKQIEQKYTHANKTMLSDKLQKY